MQACSTVIVNLEETTIWSERLREFRAKPLSRHNQEVPRPMNEFVTSMVSVLAHLDDRMITSLECAHEAAAEYCSAVEGRIRTSGSAIKRSPDSGEDKKQESASQHNFSRATAKPAKQSPSVKWTGVGWSKVQPTKNDKRVGEGSLEQQPYWPSWYQRASKVEARSKPEWPSWYQRASEVEAALKS